MLDPDLEIRGDGVCVCVCVGGGSSRPLGKGRARSPKNFFGSPGSATAGLIASFVLLLD